MVQSDLDFNVVSDFITSMVSLHYLGSLVESHGREQLEFNTRISCAACVLELLEGLFLVIICYL